MAKQRHHNPAVGQGEVERDPGPKSLVISILELLRSALAESRCSGEISLLHARPRRGRCRAAKRPGWCLGSAGKQPA